nr:MAG TPA: hypothetical protein [Bacteriophage sp.]
MSIHRVIGYITITVLINTYYTTYILIIYKIKSRS